MTPAVSKAAGTRWGAGALLTAWLSVKASGWPFAGFSTRVVPYRPTLHASRHVGITMISRPTGQTRLYLLREAPAKKPGPRGPPRPSSYSPSGNDPGLRQPSPWN